MKKLSAFMLSGIALFAAATANAEDYNRVAISYDNVHFGANKEMKADFFNDAVGGFSTNGVGLNYIHGFGLSESLPMFIETGLNFNFGFGSTQLGSEKEDLGFNGYYLGYEAKMKSQNINLQVPVNFVYKFNVADNVTLSPYIGLNFKLNLVTKYKNEVKYDTNIPENLLQQAGVKLEDEKGDWINVYSSDEKNMGDKNLTWNRFQMGWHIGVGVQYKPFYLGVQFGTDFIPAYKKDINKETYKMSTTNLKVSLGYCF